LVYAILLELGWSWEHGSAVEARAMLEMQAERLQAKDKEQLHVTTTNTPTQNNNPPILQHTPAADTAVGTTQEHFRVV
jgi:hypothetical protein